MTKASLCVNPVVITDRVDDPAFNMFADRSRADYINQVRPYMLDFELLSRCAGSCAYCYASSTTHSDFILPKEKIFEIVDDAWQLGIRLLSWGGGDPLLHPDWSEIVNYAAERGFRQYMITSGLISKEVAKKLCSLNLEAIGIHIDAINQEAYNQVHTVPDTLNKKIRGYNNLLEAGYPPAQVLGLITLTKPALERVGETLDWFVEEMGSRAVLYVQFKKEGFGSKHLHWEPGTSDIKEALEYRAKKLGSYWLSIGASDGGQFVCRVNTGVLYDGGIAPCACLRDLVVGNIYQERLTEIFEKHRDTLLFNYKIEGYCGGECEYSSVCFGCRANAYHFLGDVQASDPKCFMNPAAKETYFS